jgi:diguanylate cyclase (GGDEF)-like protein
VEDSKFIDYRTIYLILFLIVESLLLGVFLTSSEINIPLYAKIIIIALVLLVSAIVVSRLLSARILLLTDEMTESGVTIRTKKYRQEIDSTSDQLTLLNRELKRRIYDFHNLFQISIDLTSILEVDNLINSYLNTLIGQLRIKNTFLYLHDDNSSAELTMMKAKGVDEDELSNLKFHITDTIVKEVFQKNQPVIIADELTSLKEIEKFRMLDAEVITPLIHSHKLIGLLILGMKINGEPYNQTDIEMVTLITNIVAVAIANARLYEKVKESSITDELTTLFNYRYFRIRLRDEVFRSQRTNRPISLIILDVDNFKNYNDTLGHPAGDQVLKQIASILKSCIRDTDVGARYGGEEFCVIMPEENQDGARALCERLRQRVEDYPFFKEEIQPLGKLTVSLGAATYPTDAAMIKELLVRADKALYRAKNNGRNQFCIYSQATDKLTEAIRN